MTEKLKIGLAVSGGGVRASVFHLGTLKCLAEKKKLESIHYISSVSGGSLAIGLIFSLNEFKWPSSAEFLERVLPAAKKILTERDLQKSFKRSHWNPLNWYVGRANVLAQCIERDWGVDAWTLDLPELPRWAISCTCYETAKNWRFQRDKMGDFLFGYAKEPKVRLSQAMAASAGVPGVIGPLKLQTKHFHWQNYSEDRTHLVDTDPKLPALHIWDGGIHDNLGLEALHKPYKGLLKDTNYLVVSDASGPVELVGQCFADRLLRLIRAPLRLVFIAQDQIRGIRSRVVVNHFENNPGTGVYFKIGNTASTIAHKANMDLPPGEFLEPAEVRRAYKFSTTLRKLKSEEFDLLCSHGHEVAVVTMMGYPSELLE